MISRLKGKHFVDVEVQPDETCFVERLLPDDWDKLTDILGAFQPGDAEVLGRIDKILEAISGQGKCGETRTEIDGITEFLEQERDVFGRLLTAAKLMEAADHA